MFVVVCVLTVAMDFETISALIRMIKRVVVYQS
jgi:hypothetical protein